jgi:hypothetical protein
MIVAMPTQPLSGGLDVDYLIVAVLPKHQIAFDPLSAIDAEDWDVLTADPT